MTIRTPREPSSPADRTDTGNYAPEGKAGGEIATDERLLAAYVAGEESGFQVLVERHAQDLYRFLLRYVRQPTVAEDIVQETFLQVHQSAATFDAGRTFRPWLFTIGVNKARDWLRGRNRRREVPLALNTGSAEETSITYLDFLADGSATPTDLLEAEEQRRMVREVVSQMPPHLREILVLSYFHRFPYKELAEILAIPLGTVKSRLHAAVSHFATAYRERVEEPGEH